MRRRWTESGGRPARWWRPRWPAHAPAVLVVVCPRLDEVDDLVDDLALFSPLRPEHFPACESLSAERLLAGRGGRRPAAAAEDCCDRSRRTAARSCVVDQHPGPLAAGARAGGAGPADPARCGSASEVSLEELVRLAGRDGFHNTTAVELPGEFSLRGGILDIFAPDWYDPVRVELFGDEIESIRRFEVSSQRSLASLDAVEVTRAASRSSREPRRTWPTTCRRRAGSC